MDIFALAYFLTLHGVNTAMYFAVTRVAYGWTKTILALVFFFGFVAFHMMNAPHVCAAPEAVVPYCYPIGFGSWLIATVAMSRRGTRTAAFFVGVLCGAHQLVVSVVCYALMHLGRSERLSKLIASGLLLIFGTVMIRFVVPRVRCLSRSVDWRLLNVVVCILLALVYATGFWPIWAAGGTVRGALPFVFAVLMLVLFFPLVFHLSEKSREAARVGRVEENVRLMADEMRVRRAAIDEARRVRHDRRHHCSAIAELLCAKQVDKALAYVRDLDDELRGSSETLVWCENETVNAILSGCLRKAQAAHATLEAVASVPRLLEISDVELVAVLSNLIENAIQGSVRSQDPDLRTRPSVFVQLECQNGVLRFRVGNTVPDGFVLHDGWPCETPGIGLQGVRAVVARHGGGLDYVLEEGRLTAQGFLSC